jgi:hypothetical protein
MLLKRRMPRVACSVLSVATMLLGGIIAGCDSGSKEAVITQDQKNRAAAVSQAEEDTTVINKRTGKKGAIGKSIKGNIGGGAAVAD